jgi:hypothetical protein
MESENPSMTLDPKYDHYDYPTTAPTKQTGHPGHLTPEQEAQVFQLRMMLEQKGYTERLDTLTMARDLELCPQVQGLLTVMAATVPESAKVRRCTF